MGANAYGPFIGKAWNSPAPGRNGQKRQRNMATGKVPGRTHWNLALLREFGATGAYLAPVPFRTTGTVRERILMSSHSDQLSIYSRSSRTHS